VLSVASNLFPAPPRNLSNMITRRSSRCEAADRTISCVSVVWQENSSGLSSRLKRACRRHHREPRTGKAPDGAEDLPDHRIGMANMQGVFAPLFARHDDCSVEADSEGNLIFLAA